MKRASYREAVSWIALNDSAGDSDAFDEGAVSSLVTVLLIADIFDKDPEKVARDVVAYRKTCVQKLDT